MATRVTSEDILIWLRDQGWKPKIEDSGWISLTVKGKHTPLEIFVKCDLESNLIGCLAYYSAKVPPGNRMGTSELITRINFEGAGLTPCTMDMSTGEVVWASHVFVEDADFQANQFKQAFLRCIQAADLWYPAFHELIYVGRKPEAAFTKTLESVNVVFKKDKDWRLESELTGTE